MSRFSGNSRLYLEFPGDYERFPMMTSSVPAVFGVIPEISEYDYVISSCYDVTIIGNTCTRLLRRYTRTHSSRHVIHSYYPYTLSLFFCIFLCCAVLRAARQVYSVQIKCFGKFTEPFSVSSYQLFFL